VTSFIDKRQADNPLAGYVIEDGCIPQPFSPLIQIMLILQTFAEKAPFVTPSRWLEAKRLFAALKSLLLGPYSTGGALQRTATYLVMSHDSNELSLVLKGDKVVLRGPAEGRSEHFTTMKGILGRFLRSSGAKMGFSYFYGNMLLEQPKISTK
jgi:hypothetical protein